LLGNLLSNGLLILDNNMIFHNFNTDDIADFFLDYVPKKQLTEISRRLIKYYEKNKTDSPDQDLYKAGLYLYTDVTKEHLEYLVEAAKMHLSSGEKKKAYKFFNRILHFFVDNPPNRATVDYYLESVIGSLQSSRMMKPLDQIIPVLTDAWKHARQFNRWEYLSKINFRLARALALSGIHGKL
jgi:hypothetical protein